MGSMTNSEGGEQNKQGTRKERERERDTITEKVETIFPAHSLWAYTHVA